VGLFRRWGSVAVATVVADHGRPHSDSVPHFERPGWFGEPPGNLTESAATAAAVNATDSTTPRVAPYLAGVQ
jgi:hypothetical protein